MGKLFKGIIYLLAILMLLIIFGIAALVLLINPNNYKDKIVAEVQQLTNRSFSINGGLHWTFFPSLGIKAEEATFGNPKDFPQDNDFITVKALSLDVAAKPLLKGEVRVGELRVDGMTLHLIKNAQGVGNWQNILVSQPNSDTSSPASSTSHGFTPKYKITAATISAIDIKDSNFILDDDTANQHIKLTDINGTSKNIDLNQTFPLDLKCNVITSNLPNPIPVKVKADITLNQQQETVNLDKLNGSIANMELSGNLNAQMIDNKRVITGALQIPSFNANKLLNTFGKNTSVNALNNVTAQFNLSAAPDVIQLQQLKANIGGSAMNGNVSIVGDNQKSVKFNLAIDQINGAQFTGQSTKVALNNLSPIQSANAATSGSGLTGFNAQGNLKVGSVVLTDSTAKNLATTINLQNGVIQASPLSTQVYNGNLQGNLTVDTRTIPQWRFNGKFSNIDIGALLTSAKKLIHADISGVGSVTTNITTAGTSADALKQNLSGSANIEVSNGVLQGIDIPYYSDMADAIISKTSPTATDTHQTPFGQLTSSWQISKGLASNNDLSMQAPKMLVSGKGTANLVSEQLNYQLQLQRLTSGAEIKNRGAPIPILITGSFSDPKIRPDWSALVETQAKEQLSKQIEKHTEDIQKVVGNSELGKQISQGLQSLLGN